MTNKENKTRRFPAEWEKHGAILLSWPHAETDWAYMLDEVTECYVNLADEISKEEKLIIVAPDISIPQQQLSHLNRKNIYYQELPTDDTWARDFGAITVFQDGAPIICDFMFNGWGLKFKSCSDNLITRGLVKAGLLKGDYENNLGFVLEGGSVESDGNGLLLTTSECLLSPNRNGDMSREDIEQYLSVKFGLKKVLWLDYGALEGDDTDSHIDTLARLAPNDTIVYTCTDDVIDSHFDGLQAMKHQLMTFTTLDGKPFKLVELPLPDPVFDEDGCRLPATYANFLIMNRVVLMPTYSQPKKDLLAAKVLKTAYPNHEIIPVDCRALIKQHGSLHCVTMQFPNEILAI